MFSFCPKCLIRFKSHCSSKLRFWCQCSHDLFCHIQPRLKFRETVNNSLPQWFQVGSKAAGFKYHSKSYRFQGFQKGFEEIQRSTLFQWNVLLSQLLLKPPKIFKIVKKASIFKRVSEDFRGGLKLGISDFQNFEFKGFQTFCLIRLFAWVSRNHWPLQNRQKAVPMIS